VTQLAISDGYVGQSVFTDLGCWIALIAALALDMPALCLR
jgi:hypothetical protein